MAESLDGKKRTRQRGSEQMQMSSGETPGGSPFDNDAMRALRDRLTESAPATPEPVAETPVVSDAAAESAPAAEPVTETPPPAPETPEAAPAETAPQTAAPAVSETAPESTPAPQEVTGLPAVIGEGHNALTAPSSSESAEAAAEVDDVQSVGLELANTRRRDAIAFNHHIWNHTDGSAYLREIGSQAFTRVQHGEAYPFVNKDGEPRIRYYDTNKNEFTARPPRSEIEDIVERTATTDRELKFEARKEGLRTRLALIPDIEPGQRARLDERITGALRSGGLFAVDRELKKLERGIAAPSAATDTAADVVAAAEPEAGTAESAPATAEAAPRAGKSKSEVKREQARARAQEKLQSAYEMGVKNTRDLIAKQTELTKRLLALSDSKKISDEQFAMFTKEIEEAQYPAVLNNVDQDLAQWEALEPAPPMTIPDAVPEPAASSAAETPPLPPPPIPESTLQAARDARESARERVTRVANAARNVIVAIDAGIDATKAFVHERQKLDTKDIPDFEKMLLEEQQRRGVPFGIKMGPSSPAERMRKATVHEMPSWAGKYSATKEWLLHRAEAYGGLVPYTMEQLRSDPKKLQLFTEFMTAVDPSQEIFEAIAKGQPLNPDQRQFLEYCQYEFTFQYGRAESLSKNLDSGDIVRLMNHDTLLGQIGRSLGPTHLLEFYKQDVYRMAMRDKVNFNRLVNGMDEMRFRDKSWMATNRERAEQRARIAGLLSGRVEDPETQQRLDKIAFGADVSKPEIEGGPQTPEQAMDQRSAIVSEFTPAKMQELYDRDTAAHKTPDGRTWSQMNAGEKSAFRNTWYPPEVQKHTEGKGLGFWARLGYALARVFFQQEKKKLKDEKTPPQGQPQHA